MTGLSPQRVRFFLRPVDDRAGDRDLPLLSVSQSRGVVLRSELTTDEPRADDLTNYKMCRPGDIIVNRMSAYQGALGRSDHSGLVSPDYIVMRASGRVESRWLHHLMRSTWFVAQMAARIRGIGSIGTGNVRTPRVSAEEIGDIRVVVPSPDRQRAIAGFLDTETARIDALIAKRRRMIGLLEERFGAYVRARLAGVRPVLPLKRSWTVIDCKHRTPGYVDSGYPVVSPGDITAGRLDLRRAHRFVDERDYEDLADATRRPRRGDIIYSRNASIGVASYVDTDNSFCMGQDVCLITSRTQDQLYLSYVLNSVGVDRLEQQKIGSTFNRVNIAQVVELKVPTPDPQIQRQLAQEFDGHNRLLSSAVEALRKQMALLQEHRQALITAVVTGELEVPGVAV